MAVTEQTPLNTYTANGVTTGFAFAFLALQADDITVQVVDASGSSVTKTLGVDYTVAGLNVANGGTVTFLLAPANGSKVVIFRDSSLARATDYQNNGDLLSPTVNMDFDRIWLVLQEIFNGGKGPPTSLRVPNGETVPALAAAASRANSQLLFDANGNPYTAAPVSGTAADVLLQLANSADLLKGVSLIAGSGRVVNSIAALRTLPKTGTSKAFVLGYYAAGDRGGGQYFYDSTDVATADNGGSVIVASDGGRWKLATQGTVTVAQFGAKGDGATDDTAAINSALAAFKHVVVPAGMTPLITSTVTVPVASRLQFLGGLGNTNNAYPASYLIKKSTMTTVGLIVSERALVDGGGLICEVGNTGDGVAIQGNSGKIRDFLVHKAGGVGVRVGTDAGGNFNSFQLEHVTSQYNGSHGFYIHDGKLNVGADANAGTLTQCFAQFNTGDGFRLGHCFWVTVLNCLSEANTGYGIYLSGANDGIGVPQCRFATVVGGDYNEGNTAGQLFDQSYFSTWVQPDINNIPNTAGSGLAGSALRNTITNRANQLIGATVKTANAVYPFTIDEDAAGGMSYPAVIKKQGTGTNGDGAGIQWSLNQGGGYLAAGSVRVLQATSNQYNMVLAGYKSGALDILSLNVNANCIAPAQDNVWSAGLGSLRYSVVYAATGTINTSDRETKQDIAALTDAEVAVARDLKGLIRTYRFKDAVEAKGDAARIHVGAIAQEVRDAFIAHGLDPVRYALFCSDTWHEYEGRPVVVDDNGMHELLVGFELDGQAVQPDEHGGLPEGSTPVTKLVPTQQITRLGLRYEELLAFIIAAL